MTEKTTTLTLAARLLAVMDEVGYIQKQGKTQSGPSFKYVRHDDVVAAIRPALVKHGVAFMSSVETSTMGCEVVGQTKSGTDRFKTTLVLHLTFINADNPAEAYDVAFPGEGIDTDDKGSGKALSYALKNGLLKMFMIESGDDADVELEPPQREQANPDDLPIGGDAWSTLLTNAEELGFVEQDIIEVARAMGYEGHQHDMARGMAKRIFRQLRDNHPDDDPTAAAPGQSVLHDAQREQAAAVEKAPAPAPAPASAAGNGRITASQAEQLRAAIHAKGRDQDSFLGAAAKKGIGDGTLEGVPAEHYGRMLEVLAGLPDPTPETAPEPPEAPISATEASAPQHKADEPDEDEQKFLDDTAKPADGGHDPWGTVHKEGTITKDPGLLKTVALRCRDLEDLGVTEAQWREFMWIEESVTSRQELSRAAASRMLAAFKRWIVDLQAGTVVADEMKVA